MAITNLANTKWQFNNEPALSDLGTFAVNFTSNNTDYTSLTVTAERMKYGDDLAYGEPEPVYPVKGDIITMNLDGTDKQFRVLKVNDTVAEVVGLFSLGTIQFTASGATTNYTDGESGAQYADGTLDIALNQTYYSTFSQQAKDAIIDKQIIQKKWYGNNNGDPDYIGVNANSSSYTISLKPNATNAIGSRHIYALNIQDVLDYLETTPTMSAANTTLTATNLNAFSQESQVVLWLVDGAATYNNIWAMNLASGRLEAFTYAPERNYAPSFQIDLSKIDYTIST